MQVHLFATANLGKFLSVDIFVSRVLFVWLCNFQMPRYMEPCCQCLRIPWQSNAQRQFQSGRPCPSTVHTPFRITQENSAARWCETCYHCNLSLAHLQIYLTKKCGAVDSYSSKYNDAFDTCVRSRSTNSAGNLSFASIEALGSAALSYQGHFARCTTCVRVEQLIPVLPVPQIGI